MKTAFITGVTSGFGKSFAFRLAKLGGYRLIITGRRKELLQEIAEKIRKDISVKLRHFASIFATGKPANGLFNQLKKLTGTLMC
jgi:short-subunit dehydrogenase